MAVSLGHTLALVVLLALTLLGAPSASATGFRGSKWGPLAWATRHVAACKARFTRVLRPPSGVGTAHAARFLTSHKEPFPSTTNNPLPVPGLCFEKIFSNGAIYMMEHPARGKMVVATQQGLLQLTTLPAVKNGTAQVVGTFLDLTSRVLYDYKEQGFLSFAFHPSFLSNGRFFVSYICDSSQHKDCQAPCSFPTSGKTNPKPTCKYNTVIAEYSAGTNPGTAKALNPTEVKKIFMVARPWANHNGGHIWFGPDGFMYITQGDGGSTGDPLNMAQNGSVFFGKMLRIDVNSSVTPYVVPPDNPFVNNTKVRPEIYALGLRNAWRCSVDPNTTVLFCGDVGQDKWEEIDVITKGGNYGWSYLEANSNYKTQPASFSPLGGNFTAPIFSYMHDEPASRAVIGGFVYRANRNPCLQGKYIYSDFKTPMYVATVYPLSAANSTSVPFRCPASQACSLTGTRYSWGTDLANELYHLSSSGIHRVIDASYCQLSC